jgi:predicted Zn-dependent protease with MMP-like domain
MRRIRLNDDETRRLAREVYASLPEDNQDELRQVVEMVSKESGQEVTPDLIEKLMEGVIALRVSNLDAIFNEITEEERHQIFDEEYERLDTGQGVDEEQLMEAVMARVHREYGHILSPRDARPPE